MAFTDGNADNNDIYYEADKINEGDTFAQALGHENSRHDQAEKGKANHTADGFSTAGDEQAIKAGLHNVSAMKREMKHKGIERDSDTAVSYVRTDYDNALINNGTLKADGVSDVEPMSPEALFRYAYNRDTGRNADEDWEQIPVVIEKGVETAGDAVQAIPDPVLSGAGFVAGGAAILGTGGVAGVAAGVGYVASGLGVTKTLINTAEGKESYAGAGVELALESASTFIPYAGPLIDVEILYDTIKYNYESGYKISFDSLGINNE